VLYGFEHVPERRSFRVTAVLYGLHGVDPRRARSLWLNLRDVYWQKQGGESVEAPPIFAGFLLWVVLIAPFALAVWRPLRCRA